MGRTLTLAACLILAAALAWLQERTPRPLPADAPADAFAAARAMDDVRAIARAPHPLGSPANLQVRDHLVRRMAELGLEPQVRRMDSLAFRKVGAQDDVYGARVENLVGVLRGRDRAAPAVLVMAHYDSVPGSPGAADDATGVAAALETMRALKARGTPTRDVMVLLTDGEEAGLLGGGAFFRADPLAKRVGFVLNMEARGGAGRAQMFQTGPRDAQTIDLFRRTAIRPASSSAAVFLYELTPNDTDFTRSRAAGIPGLNYAFIGRQFDYHSASSTPANLDQGALQDIGRQVLAAAAGAAFSPSLPKESRDAVYAHAFGPLIIAYPPWAGWVLLAVVAALAAVGAVRARRAGELAWSDVARGAGAALYLSFTAASVLRLARRATGVHFGFVEQRALLAQAGRFEAALLVLGLGVILFTAAALARGKSRVAAAGVALAAALGGVFLGGAGVIGLSLGAAGAIVAAAVFGPPVGLAGAWAGVLTTGLLVAAALQASFPVAAFLVAWPLALAALAAAASGFGAARMPAARIAVAAPAVVGLVWLGGFIHGVYLGLDQPELLALFAWLAAILIWPLAHPHPDETPRPGVGLVGLVVLAAGCALIAWVRVADPWTVRYPQTTMVAYQVDLNARRAYRVSILPAKHSAWVRAVLSADGGRIGGGNLRPFYGRPVEAAAALWIPAAGPALSLDRGPDGRITLRAAPPPGARLLVLDLRADVAVTDPRIDGHPAPVLRGPGRRTRVRWEASPGGFALSFASAGPGALEVRYAAVTEAWPAAATPLPKRPPDVMAFAESDSTIVTGSRRLAWRSAP